MPAPTSILYLFDFSSNHGKVNCLIRRSLFWKYIMNQTRYGNSTTTFLFSQVLSTFFFVMWPWELITIYGMYMWKPEIKNQKVTHHTCDTCDTWSHDCGNKCPYMVWSHIHMSHMQSHDCGNKFPYMVMWSVLKTIEINKVTSHTCDM